MIVALDLGCSEFRSLRMQRNRLVARRMPAVYCVLENQPQNRRFLESSRIDYSSTAGELLVLGHDAVSCAQTLKQPLVPVLPDGHMPYEDSVGRQICALMLNALLPTVSRHEKGLCVASIPGNREDALFFNQIIQLHRFAPTTVPSSQAITLAELEGSQYCGLGISIGAQELSISLNMFGKPIYSATYHRGANHVAMEFAKKRHKYLWDFQGNRTYDLAAVDQWQRQGRFSLMAPQNGDEELLATLYWRLLVDAWTALFPDLLRVADLPHAQRNFDVVISGGPTALSGFSELLTESLRHVHCPLHLGDMHVASDSFSVSRGLLVHARSIVDADRTAGLSSRVA